ncbi:YqaJ viral recombinase family protein [Vibrio navarrensis]|nr:YqaJ viral recombinase family protein [Vibrio navarrensis]
MPVVDIVQRSEKWHVWRKEGITASMIPVIMGLSPYQTPYELWAELVGYKKPDDLSNNYHVQRGVEQEPEARGAVETEYGKPYMPVCVEADHNRLFRASLDGLYMQGNDKEVLEIKCPCEKIYNEILTLKAKAKAPTFQMYAAQVQWQLNAAGASVGRLYFYLRGKNPVSTLIRRNDAFIEKAEKAALHFLELVLTKQPPKMIEGRDKVVYDTPISSTDEAWLAKVEQYKEKKAYYEELERKTKAVKADLKQLESYFTDQIPSDVKTFSKDGIRATRVEKEGSVNYNALLDEIQSTLNVVIPDELYKKHRNESSTYFLVNVQEQPSDKDVPIEQYNPVIESVESPVQEVVTPRSAEIAMPAGFKTEQTQPPEKQAPAEKEESVPSQPLRPLDPSVFFEKSVQKMYF